MTLFNKIKKKIKSFIKKSKIKKNRFQGSSRVIKGHPEPFKVFVEEHQRKATEHQRKATESNGTLTESNGTL